MPIRRDVRDTGIFPLTTITLDAPVDRATFGEFVESMRSTQSLTEKVATLRKEAKLHLGGWGACEPPYSIRDDAPPTAEDAHYLLTITDLLHDALSRQDCEATAEYSYLTAETGMRMRMRRYEPAVVAKKKQTAAASRGGKARAQKLSRSDAELQALTDLVARKKANGLSHSEACKRVAAETGAGRGDTLYRRLRRYLARVAPK